MTAKSFRGLMIAASLKPEGDPEAEATFRR